MSNDDKMREAFDNFWLRNNPGLDSSFKGVAWAVFKTCAAIKDAEIAELKIQLQQQMGHNNFDSTRLQRLATFCGVACPESQEELLQVAGVVIGSCMRVLESNAKEIKSEIAARDLMIKELREALTEIAGYNGNSVSMHHVIAQQALAKSEHHNSRALAKLAELNKE